MRALGTAVAAAVAAIIVLTAAAHAQPGTVPASEPLVDKLLRAAQIAARSGKCETAQSIGQRVLQMDPAFHARAFATDPEIAGCVEGVDTRPPPPPSDDVTGLAPGATPIAIRTEPREGELSETTALALALGGTAASWGFVALAVYSHDDGDGENKLAAFAFATTLVAPSFGNIYAGTRFTRGLGLRLTGVGVAFIAAMWALSEGLSCLFEDDESQCNQTDGPGYLALAGAGLYAGGTIDDIVTTPGRVREKNRRLRGGLAIVPVIREGSGGVALSGRF